MLGCDVVDQLHHVYGFTNTGTPEQTHFTTLGEGADQVDYLDAGFQQIGRRGLFCISRRLAVNGGALLFTDGAAFVDGVTQNVHDSTQGFSTNRHADGRSGAGHVQATLQAFSRTHGDGTNDTVTQLLLNFENGRSVLHVQCVVHVWYRIAREFYVNYRSDDLYDTSATHVCILLNRNY